jgi:hypothetical protein
MSSAVKALPATAADCSIRSPMVAPDLVAVADTTGNAGCPSGGSVNDTALSLRIVPVAPTRSRRMIRAGLPTADADADLTVA